MPFLDKQPEKRIRSFVIIVIYGFGVCFEKQRKL